ncbi:MAG: hypothetical protein N2578_10320, partial [Bdellovibrionaceae bacterium]|nr:hypothetical protein [Pseudobdellovibrionaceae bacterium]
MRQPGLTVKILLFMKILFGLCPLTCGAQRSLDYAHASPKLPTNSDTGRQTENSTTVPTDLRPLDFDVVDRELKIKRLVFSPDMKSSNGKSIKFGDILFDENTLKAELKGQQLSVNWDPRFIKSGELSIVDRDGKEKFKAPANGAGSWSMALNFDEQKRIFSDSGRFRFCLRHQQNSQYFTALCSRWYAARAVHTGFEIDPARDKTEPRMFVDQEEVRPSFQREVQPGTPLHFFANIASGDTLEFLDQPTPPQILDAVKIDDKHFQIKGLVPAPINPQPQIISGENYPGFVRSIGFE